MARFRTYDSLPPSAFFPPADLASPEGLIGVGGQLTPDWLLDAYRHGIFPWPFANQQLAWWSPDPRAIFELDGLHISRRLARTCRSGRFRATCNCAFREVLQGCATAQHRRHGSWLTSEMREAYQKLHELGYAHSVEVWHDGQLAGGTYGVALGGLFAAESMFYRVRDASKVALVHLLAHLNARGYELLDIQQLTPHTESLGATEISRRAFLARLSQALESGVSFGERLEPGPNGLE
ncbi:MAG TPA: leucyl/phenylalanyl-tRNA--protein transferase [Pirellulales bacterium]|nr:leucyl/phenylalanyl-tRNA--protein transferase [Pirellulales bacterium]